MHEDVGEVVGCCVTRHANGAPNDDAAVFVGAFCGSMFGSRRELVLGFGAPGSLRNMASERSEVLVVPLCRVASFLPK